MGSIAHSLYAGVPYIHPCSATMACGLRVHTEVKGSALGLGLGSDEPPSDLNEKLVDGSARKRPLAQRIMWRRTHIGLGLHVVAGEHVDRGFTEKLRLIGAREA